MPLLYIVLVIFFSACNNETNTSRLPPSVNQTGPASNPYACIGDIPLPPGYSRVAAGNNSYVSWLRKLPLKKNKTVFTYDGRPKHNQAAQFAVLDVSVGNKDLQQCADAVIRLRAEYLYEQRRLNEIDFSDNNHVHYRLPANANRMIFDRYLEKVFSYCGTASLANQLLPVNAFTLVSGGDVLIKAGAPGHAMQVIDIAMNKQGEKIYLLAQSYMPAQDIHVVINPLGNQLSPWYGVTKQTLIETPEWLFHQADLKRWPGE